MNAKGAISTSLDTTTDLEVHPVYQAVDQQADLAVSMVISQVFV
jgi:hypothetical protein